MVKISFSLDKKAEYDLLMKSLTHRKDELAKAYLAAEVGPGRRAINEEHSAVEDLIKKLV